MRRVFRVEVELEIDELEFLNSYGWPLDPETLAWVLIRVDGMRKYRVKKMQERQEWSPQP